MATIATSERTTRLRLMVPKEHGAWVILLMPIAIGAGVAGDLGPEGALFLLAAVSCFALRSPLGLILRPRRGGRAAVDHQASLWLGLYVGLVGLSGTTLVLGYGRWYLVPLGLIALTLLALQQVLQRNRLDRTALGELLAFAGLTLTGPGVYYALIGRLDSTAFALWLLCFVYAGAGIFYVKLRVQQRVQRVRVTSVRKRVALGLGMLVYQCSALALLAVVTLAGLVPSLSLLAYIPLTLKVAYDIARAPLELNLRRLGFREVGHSLVFTVLLILAFVWHH